MDYPFKEIEETWQEYWEKHNTFKTNIESKTPKFYCLDMFPYPSGAGLHVGHPEGYTATDIISRYKRMKGFEVLHPMGWDSFGLPAERYAMKHGIHPKITTEENINNFRRQIKMLGLSYDWSREIATSDPNYYKHTQWIFLKLYNSYFDKKEKKAFPIQRLVEQLETKGTLNFFDENVTEHFTADEWEKKTPKDKEDFLSQYRLVYEASIPVNWCEELGTVLANEEVDEWVEKGYEVVRRPMRQFMMRITAYAERLLEDLSLVEWPNSTLEMQKNWIGKSEGLELKFPIEKKEFITVFTTRPDTIFGATYLVLAPEHELVEKLTTPEQKEAVEKYIKETSLKSDLDRTELNKDKSGVFTGSYAFHPADHNKKIPIWIGDYVLASYGTGAIMAVPAHDERDFEFAKKFNLPIIHVIHGAKSEDECFDSKDSYCINSMSEELEINDLSYSEAFLKVGHWVEARDLGKRKIQFKLRDWLFARQRYWGEPIPLIHGKDGLTHSLDEKELPLELPDITDFNPSSTGESALAKAGSWLNYITPKLEGKRETNTMPQWAGSCWYYLRFIDPVNPWSICNPELEKKWMPVDIYIGGAEHAVLHLLYSRFWHKVLFDLGYVSTPEPFKKLVHQGLILGEDKTKMSKSLGNVVNPDDVVDENGADSFRLFEMFMGPFEMSKPWSTKGVEGVKRFLNRVWRLYHNETGEFTLDETEPDIEQLKVLNRTIKKVEEDIDNFGFNTAISQMMIFVNEMTPKKTRPLKVLKPFIL
ncbi:MAG: leucine--tRNA ligase, partial [Leptospiraceae bacterium]|nr:leucine--tRNA ligase [Leptospiraceae bacterium]